MAKSGKKLTARQEEAIVALLTARSIEEAARTLDVPPRTLHRWLKQPLFDAAYRAAKRTAFSQSSARLQQMASAAVTTLGKIMVDPGAAAASRVRAADCILNRAARAIEIEDIETRVLELELAAELSQQDR